MVHTETYSILSRNNNTTAYLLDVTYIVYYNNSFNIIEASLFQDVEIAQEKSAETTITHSNKDCVRMCR